MYTERHDDRCGVEEYHQRNGKKKVAILKVILSLTGSQRSALSSGLHVFMSALAKNNFCCVALNFPQPVLRESISEMITEEGIRVINK